jgi:hypothetical protein
MDTQTLAIAVLLISFLVMILLRFPIAYAVALSSVLCLLAQGRTWSPSAVRWSRASVPSL